MMMFPADDFEMREQSGSHEQPRPPVQHSPRRIKLLDGITLRAWP